MKPTDHASSTVSRPVNIPIAVVMRTMLAVMVLLHAANLLAQWITMSPTPSDAAIAVAELFTFTTQGKIPTWFITAALLGCAVLGLIIGLHKKSERFRVRWFVLSGVFVLLSIDKAAAIGNEWLGYLWPLLTGEVNVQGSTHALLGTLAELLYMSVVTVFVFALLRYMQRQNITVATIRFSSRLTFITLGSAIVLLVFAGISGQFSAHVLGHERLLGFVRLFHLDGEENITAWFSAMVLLTVAAGCLLCALSDRSKKPLRMWWVLAVVFTLFSIDEFASLHELSIEPLRELWQTSGLLHFPWVLAGAVTAGSVFLLCLGDLLRLPRRTAAHMIVCGAIYISGALGVEMIGGWWASTHDIRNLSYQLISATEETLEMIGASLFIVTLVTRLRDHPIEIGIGKRRATKQLPTVVPDEQPRSRAA